MPGKRGRVPKSQSKITPAALLEINRLWLEHVPITAIAERYGVTDEAIRYWIKKEIKPAWQERARGDLDELLAKVELIERTAWERFHSDAPCETREQIEEALRDAKEDGEPSMEIIRRAMRRVSRPGQAAWLQVIGWCLDFRAKIHGHYAAQRIQHEVAGELRVAGMSRQEADHEQIKRCLERLRSRLTSEN